MGFSVHCCEPQHLARSLTSGGHQQVFVEQMSSRRGRKQIVLCAYFTDEEPEAREIGGVGFAQNHRAHQGGAGLGLVHWAQVPKLDVPSPTSLPPLGAKGD